MKKIVKVPVAYETELSKEELEEKLKGRIEEQALPENLPEKSRQYFYWRSNEDFYELKFYHSFRSDMCDTAFVGKIEKGLSGSRLDGEIKKPAGVWAVFWSIIGAALLISVVFFLSLLLSEEPELGMIPIFMLVVFVPAAFVEVNLLMFDTKRLKTINKYLRDFTEATNLDILEDELENDR